MPHRRSAIGPDRGLREEFRSEQKRAGAAYLVLAALLGLTFGTITRSASGALAIVVAVALLVPALAPGLPGVIGDVAGTYWPTTAGQASYATTATGALHPLAGIAVMGVVTVRVTLAAHLALGTRDA